MRDTLEGSRIAGLPAHFYYIPDFLSREEESHVLEKIDSSPGWVHLSQRRLQVYPTQLSRNNVLLMPKKGGLPSFLTSPIVDSGFEKLGVFAETPHHAPNHVLVNEYMPGQGIMPHEDGDAYAPVVATVSLGSTTVLDIYQKTEAQGHLNERNRAVKWRIYQEPRSLLITTGTAYRSLLHGIAQISVDGDLRPASDHTDSTQREILSCSDSGEAASEQQPGIANWDLLSASTIAKLQDSGRQERGRRVSLTYRDVLKVRSNIF